MLEVVKDYFATTTNLSRTGEVESRGARPGEGAALAAEPADPSALRALTPAPLPFGRGVRAAAPRSNLAPRQEVIQPADAVPAVAVAFEDEAVLAVLARPAVVLGEEVREHAGAVVVEADVEGDLARLAGEVVHEDA